MINLIKMDLYKMRKLKSFYVMLILTALFSFAQTPMLRLLMSLSSLLEIEDSSFSLFPKTCDLSSIIGQPYPVVAASFALLSVCYFFYADMENGYIKNIAGQVPKRGYTMSSRYLASIFHNLTFVVVGIVANLIGTMIFQKIIVDAGMKDAVIACLLKFLLMQSIYAILVLVVSVMKSKSFGTTLAVIMGTGMMELIYTAISSGVTALLKLKSFDLAKYMPDALMNKAQPPVIRSLIVACVTIVLFMALSRNIFDRRDVK